MDALAERWPMRRFPLLVDGDRTVIETSTIIEHLQVHHPGRWAAIPAEPDAALEVRMLDRFFDNYVSTPQQKVVFDALRPGDARDPRGVAEAVAMLETAYAWLDQRMATRTGRRRSASVSPTAAPRPSCSMRISPSRPPPRLRHLRAYRARLLERHSFARAVDEARPYRPLFPLCEIVD